MRNIAEFQIIGRIGSINKLDSATRLAIAANYPSKDEHGNWKDHTYWNSVVVFSERIQAYIERTLGVGDLVHARGRIGHSSFERNGETVYTVDLVCNQFARLARSSVTQVPTSTPMRTRTKKRTSRSELLRGRKPPGHSRSRSCCAIKSEIRLFSKVPRSESAVQLGPASRLEPHTATDRCSLMRSSERSPTTTMIKHATPSPNPRISHNHRSSPRTSFKNHPIGRALLISRSPTHDGTRSPLPNLDRSDANRKSPRSPP